MRTHTQASLLADVFETEVGTRAGGRTRKIYYEKRLLSEIAARIYQTDVVTWRPDGTIVLNTGGWDTPTTFDAIAAALGVSRGAIGTRNKVPHWNGTPFTQKLIIKPDGEVIAD